MQTKMSYYRRHVPRHEADPGHKTLDDKREFRRIKLRWPGWFVFRFHGATEPTWYALARDGGQLLTIENNRLPYRICSFCIMDTSDPDIEFDAEGRCQHCRNFHTQTKAAWHPDDGGKKMLDSIVERIKEERRNESYDCVIGLSGGVDSSYLAYVASKQLKLRLLAVHVDGGWNSELAVKNIEGIVKKLNIDLYTEVIDWDEMRHLQRAFLRAGLANQDVPQDHAFISGLYREATRLGIPYVLSGGNIATESILPPAWAYNAMDLRHLKAIHRRFGEQPLKTFPNLSLFKYYFWYPVVKHMTVLRPLDLLPYDAEEAIRTLTDEVGFRYYGGKHFESRFTKWQQLHYRPVKFGYDSRRAHFSSLIVSGQMRREDALRKMAEVTPDRAFDGEDSEYVRKKLGFSRAEFAQILAAPPKTFRDYPSNYFWFQVKDRLKARLGSLGITLKSRS
jgi:N-acetyl sugar amidotransferase